MADRSVNLRLGVDISGLRSQLTAARASVTDFAKTTDKRFRDNSASVDSLSASTAVAGAALLGLAGVAVKRFADFDKAMSAVRASTRATGAELASLRAAAVKAGADTAFSASEAAEGINELAKAGVATKDILAGGLSGALNLAAAGQISVAEAAETAASAMTQFGLKGTDVGHIADLLAAGAGKAQGSVSDMGAALNQAGLISAQVGLSIEETTGALAAMASAGLVGSDSGTSLKTALLALSAPSATAAKEMERLGISAYDANGQFVGLEALSGNLETSLKNLTPAQRNAALATIFGTDAIRTANVLYEQGAEGVAEWTDKVNDAGFASDQARIQTDNLSGDIERLGGSIDTAFIKSGSGANDGLRQVVQGAESVVDAVGEIPGGVLSATTAIAGPAGLALLGVAGLGKLTVSAAEAKSAMSALGVTTKAASIAAGALGGAIAIGTIAFTSWATAAAEAEARTDGYLSTLDELGSRTDKTIKQINTALSADQNTWFDNIPLFNNDAESLIDRADRVGIAIEDLQKYILDEGDAVERVTAATEEYIRQQGNATTPAEVRAQASRFLTGALDNEAASLTDAEKAAAQKARADEAAGVAAEGATAATEGATGAIDLNTEAIQKNLDAAREAAGVVLSERDAQRSLEAAFDDARAAIEENGKTLDVTTAKGRANESALDDVADGAWGVAESMYAAGASGKQIAARMQEARDAFIRTATSAGATKAEARELANQLGLVPSDVETILKARDQATGPINDVKDGLDGLPASKTIRITTIRDVLGPAPGTGTVLLPRGATGMRLPGFPTGGRLPGQSPANPAEDNLLGVDGAGIPRVRVRSREWVINEGASDYYGDGLLSAINSRAIPREELAGLRGLAGGGAVGQAENALKRAQRLSLSARRAVEEARREERQARSESAKRAAERRTQRYEELHQERQAAVDEARDKLARVRDEAASVSTALRRGSVSDAVTGGLSGALGVTDQLRDLASSGDVSRYGSRRLNDVAGDAEKALTSLYKQAEAVDSKLADATDRLSMWQQIADGVSSSISGAFSLGGVSGGVDPFSGQERQATGQQLLAASQEYQGKARTLVVKLRELQKAGYGTAILQEVAAQGVDGGVAMAEALLQLSPADAQALQASQAQIDFYAGRAGDAATDGNLVDAARDVRTAEAQVEAIDKKIGGWAKVIGAEMANALGIKPRAAGGPVTAGAGYLVNENTPRSEIFVPQQSGYILNRDKAANTMGAGRVVYQTNHIYYPQAEPVAKTTNRALQKVAE